MWTNTDYELAEIADALNVENEKGVTTMPICEDCEFRKSAARCFDMHFDWRDCWKKECEYRDKKESENVEDAIEAWNRRADNG